MAECIIAGRGSSSYTSNKPVYRSSITITNSTELPLPTALHNEYEVLYLAVAVAAVASVAAVPAAPAAASVRPISI